jgi:uncharacterized protein
LEPKIIAGDHKNEGKIAVLYGPLVLAADAALLSNANDGSPVPLRAVALAGPTLADLHAQPEPAPANVKSWDGARVVRINGVTRRPIDSLPAGSPLVVPLIPFADAGGTGTDYKVWLPLRGGNQVSSNLLLEGREERSRAGNMDGSINDDDVHSIVVTFDGQPAGEDCFSVPPDQPVTIGRVFFAHGRSFHDGGWFDPGGGKPRIEVLRSPGGSWEKVGELGTYPDTTARTAGTLRSGQMFQCNLDPPIKAFAVRVIGKPASGDNPAQAFASCAEVQAFSR